MSCFKYSVASTDIAPCTSPLLLHGSIEKNISKAKELNFNGIEAHLREDAFVDIPNINETLKSNEILISAIVTVVICRQCRRG